MTTDNPLNAGWRDHHRYPDPAIAKERAIVLDPGIIEIVVLIATACLAGTGAKLLLWGRRPIFGLRDSTDDPASNQRLVDLEDRVDELAEVAVNQSQLLKDYHERLDFTERLLTERQEEPTAPELPAGERS